MKNDNYRGDDNDDGDDDDDDRLLAVPFWIVESAREIAERKSRNLERTHGGGPALLVFSPRSYLARPLDFPERACWQSNDEDDNYDDDDDKDVVAYVSFALC